MGDTRLKKDALEISCEASTHTTLFSRRVNANEDEVRFSNALVNLSRKEQVAPARLSNDIFETRLVDGQLEILVIPRIDPRLVYIDDRHLDVGALQSYD